MISDAFLVGEGWISEHYFTTDATAQSFQARVIERRKEWDAEDKEGRPTPRSRFLAARAELAAAFGRLGAQLEGDEAAERDRDAARELAEPIHDRLLDVFELERHGLHHDRIGPIARVSAPGIAGRPLAIVRAEPVATLDELIAKDGNTLAEPVRLFEGGDEYRSSARLLSALFVDDDAPEFVLVLAGRWALLAERERWAEGRYLAVDVQAVAERNDTRRGGEIDRLLTCVAAASIAPDADGGIWWRGVLDESIKHTVGVSQDLRDGVRLSIEIIANDVVTRRVEQGRPPLTQSEAQPLAVQALRFLYRILFLLYAEASPELGVLPVGAQQYDEGYSLDRLRELVQVPLASPRAKTGTHLYQSLGKLFQLVDQGHDAATPDAEDGLSVTAGLTFNALRADLFRPAATAQIDAVELSNEALQRVLGHLLLSKEKRGRDRGFISYAELGINQLGAVYEGLMSYTGFFAEDDLIEVAKGGDASKGSWVIPVERAEGIAKDDFVRTVSADGQPIPVIHERGSFVFRLAGRERQRSASYYTQEVLTRFTVGQALAELLDQGDATTSATDILGMTVCEPALGSGAFAIEAVRQLAAQYLERRQKELDHRIDPDEYPRELQRVKAYLALHNVYGVDLNATAVELAEISLWLDTMVEGLAAPWFGLHLRRGNSLIGARRAVYSRNQVSDKSWLTAVPREVPLTSLPEDIEGGTVGNGINRGIHHFLLPADGWGATADAQEAAALVPDAATAVKSWRKSIKAKPTKKQVDDLSELGHRVEVLWQFAFQRLRIAEHEIRRAIPVWGSGALSIGGAVQREQIESALADAGGAYRRLRRVMDAWCAMWFWPLTEAATTPPTLEQWIAGLQAVLGRSPEVRKRTPPAGQTFGSAAEWETLGNEEKAELSLAGARPTADVLREHRWLAVCERVAQRQGFFHWHLEFAPVFAAGGGFDLQVGNPPWVRPTIDEDALLAEGDPWWKLAIKPSEEQIAKKRDETLGLPGMVDLVVDGTSEVAATAEFVGSLPQYPHLQGLQPDLYRCFMERAWAHASVRGMTGMISWETHFTDERAGLLRAATYSRLRRHWEFINELKLFEIQDQKHYGVSVYGTVQSHPHFMNAVSMYHPDTVLRSLTHDGSGPEPGYKDEEGRWDLRPHRNRIVTVDDEVLRTWHEVLEGPDVPIRRTRMVYAVNRSAARVLDKLARAPRIKELGLQFCTGWHEKTDRAKGFFESAWGTPEGWRDVILQGPHLFVATPLYKSPNKTMMHQQDWSATDFETLATDVVPVTSYKPIGDRAKYDVSYTHWIMADGTIASARDYYRLAWRNMAANTGERTLMPALIPPGAAHIHGVTSAAAPDGSIIDVVQAGAFASSLLADFAVRVAPKSTISAGTVSRLPFARSALDTDLQLRTLRLNAVTDSYADLWRDCFDVAFLQDAWSCDLSHTTVALNAVESCWSADTPLRRAIDRRQALVEIDALVALMLGVTADELCTIYRTQFAVLYGYDRNTNYYDANGRLVPNAVLTIWRKKQDKITEDERTATNHAGNTYTYELPYRTLDREADMRQAYGEFERRLAERS